MFEQNDRFPMFEKLLEKRHPTAYHEEIEQRSDLPIGLMLAVFGFLPSLFSNLSLGLIPIIGLIASFFGILIILRGLVLYRKQLKKYSFQGLTRQSMSDAIMYIDAQLARPEDFKSPAPYHDMTPYSSFKLSVKKTEFTKFLMQTAGLVTWPSKIIDEQVTNRPKKKKAFYNSLILLIAVILILAVIILYTLITWNWLIIPWLFVPAICMLQIMYYIVPHLHYLNRYYNNQEWISLILKSDTVQLEESLEEIFKLLQTEFPYPLCFHLVKEYPLLKYTGRTDLSFTLITLKQAVLYPNLKT